MWGWLIRYPLSMVAIILLATVALAAQDKPDFSGQWVLETPLKTGADIPRVLRVQQLPVRTNIRGEPIAPFFKDIIVERAFESGLRSDTYLIGVMGGTVAGLHPDGSPARPNAYYGVKWAGDALAFESGTYTGEDRETGTWTARREVWSLDPNGRLRVVISARSSVDVERIVTVTYRRQ